MDKRKLIVASKFIAIADAETGETPTKNYFTPITPDVPRNAFLFERENILIIFFSKYMVKVLESLDIMKKGPTHLLAILGAHHQKDDPFKEGQSTVIVMGVKPKEGVTVENILDNAENVPIGSLEAGYVKSSSNDEEVGYEYPPSTGLVEPPPSAFPLDQDPNPISFKFLS